MNILTGLQNFLTFINDNWTAILLILTLIISVVAKVKTFFAKSKDEKSEIAKQQVEQVILKLVTDAECKYEEWKQSGSIKRSWVFEQIYSKFPFLPQDWIDKKIDEALETMRGIIKNSDSIEDNNS